MTRLRLIPPAKSDAAAWAAWRNEPLGRRFNPLKPSAIEVLERRLEACSSDLRDRTVSEYRWMMEYGGELIGTVALSGLSWSMGYAEISYWLAEAFHGRGLGSRAVAMLLDLVFAESELERLSALISRENLASKRLIERLGFTLEGCLREHYLIQGRRVDVLVYGLLRREWASPASDPRTFA